jgi:HicA toxin of bacterial toxin-antitoxin,
MSRHDKTLEALFASPTRANIRWDDAVSLVVYYGADVKSSGGSAHKFTMPNGSWVVIHKPHPGNQLSRGRVQAFRDLLVRAGLDPTLSENAADNGNADV